MLKHVFVAILLCLSMLYSSSLSFGQNDAEQPAIGAQNSSTNDIAISPDKRPGPSEPDVSVDCTACWPYDILLGLLMATLGATLGAVVAVFYEGLGHAKLDIKLGEVIEHEYPNHGVVRFLRVEIHNRPRKVLFVTRKTAYACEAKVTFKSPTGDTIGPMAGRWAGNPEPLQYEVVDGKIQTILNPTLLAANRLTNIPPLRFRHLDIAMRRRVDREAYGWTDESYRHGWRHPDFKLPDEHYEVHVEVTTGDRTSPPKSFRLMNPESADGFNLESV